MKKSMLLVNDMPGVGKVALAAMVPVLNYLGMKTYSLPTALISNTFNYGNFEILNTTKYMKHTLEVYEALGFTYDCICTGYMFSKEQMDLIYDLCREKQQKGTFIMVDPIMADGGKLYNGISKEYVEQMKKLCTIADLLVPNVTEASFLTDLYLGNQELTNDQVKELMMKLYEMSSSSVVITSVCTEGETAVWGYDKHHKEFFTVPYTLIHGRFPGTGDLFSSILIGRLLTGCSLKESVKNAVTRVEILINRYQNSMNEYNGIPIEQCLDILDDIPS
ncbi:MAG TPA: pyridoxamine kinase [Candidatus Merdenecus merdavium]|nr:pyridoxamine kinase [Candidatus Merdenecus merdavium]